MTEESKGLRKNKGHEELRHRSYLVSSSHAQRSLASTSSEEEPRPLSCFVLAVLFAAVRGFVSNAIFARWRSAMMPFGAIFKGPHSNRIATSPWPPAKLHLGLHSTASPNALPSVDAKRIVDDHRDESPQPRRRRHLVGDAITGAPPTSYCNGHRL